MVLRLPESLKIQTAVSFDWIAIVGIGVVVVYINYPQLRELYFAPDRVFGRDTGQDYQQPSAVRSPMAFRVSIMQLESASWTAVAEALITNWPAG